MKTKRKTKTEKVLEDNNLVIDRKYRGLRRNITLDPNESPFFKKSAILKMDKELKETRIARIEQYHCRGNLFYPDIWDCHMNPFFVSIGCKTYYRNQYNLIIRAIKSIK